MYNVHDERKLLQNKKDFQYFLSVGHMLTQIYSSQIGLAHPIHYNIFVGVFFTTTIPMRYNTLLSSKYSQ